MLQVRKINYQDDSFEVVQTFSDDQKGVCFEFANTLHAATMNLCEDPEMNAKHSGPYAIHITDENGESMWKECSSAYLPQTPNTLQ